VIEGTDFEAGVMSESPLLRRQPYACGRHSVRKMSFPWVRIM